MLGVRDAIGCVGHDRTVCASTAVPAGSVVNYDLVCRQLSSGAGKVKRGRTVIRRRILDGVVKLPLAGRWVFSAIYNGPNGVKSQTSRESKAVTLR